MCLESSCLPRAVDKRRLWTCLIQIALLKEREIVGQEEAAGSQGTATMVTGGVHLRGARKPGIGFVILLISCWPAHGPICL